jgi:tRNA threonylcarbamoyladenosine biosynthesis protein TsaE
MVEIIENQLSLSCSSLNELPQIASKILEFKGDRTVISFDGQLGAGKTTLIKELCLSLGVEDNVTSPSFAIINEYQDGNDNPVYHFDFYRIKDVEEALDIGAEEYFYSGHLCLVEWPSKAEELIPEDSVSIEIEVTGHNSRIFYLKRHDR